MGGESTRWVRVEGKKRLCSRFCRFSLFYRVTFRARSSVTRGAELGRAPSLYPQRACTAGIKTSPVWSLRATPLFISRDRDICFGRGSYSASNTRAQKVWRAPHPRAGARCPRGPGSAGSGHERRHREHGARDSPARPQCRAQPGPAPPARTAGTGRAAPLPARPGAPPAGRCASLPCPRGKQKSGATRGRGDRGSGAGLRSGTHRPPPAAAPPPLAPGSPGLTASAANPRGAGAERPPGPPAAPSGALIVLGMCEVKNKPFLFSAPLGP